MAVRLYGTAYSPSVRDEIDVQGITKVGRNQVGKYSLQLLMVKAFQVQSKLPVHAKPAKDTTDVCVSRKHGPAKCIQHDAVSALPLDLGQRTKEFFEFFIIPFACGLECASAESVTQFSEGSV